MISRCINRGICQSKEVYPLYSVSEKRLQGPSGPIPCRNATPLLEYTHFGTHT